MASSPIMAAKYVICDDAPRLHWYMHVDPAISARAWTTLYAYDAARRHTALPLCIL